MNDFHIFKCESILNQVDDQSLTKVKETSGDILEYLDKKRFLWIRIIKVTYLVSESLVVFLKNVPKNHNSQPFHITLKFGFSEKATKFEKNLRRTFDKNVVFCARNEDLKK